MIWTVTLRALCAHRVSCGSLAGSIPASIRTAQLLILAGQSLSRSSHLLYRRPLLSALDHSRSTGRSKTNSTPHPFTFPSPILQLRTEQSVPYTAVADSVGLVIPPQPLCTSGLPPSLRLDPVHPSSRAPPTAAPWYHLI